MRIVAAAVIYFLWSMTAGFILGFLREFALVPSLGFTAGNLIEAAFMLLAIGIGARSVANWCRVPPAIADRIGMGVLSLALVLAAELAFSPVVHGSMAAWLAKFTPLTLALTLILWAAQASAPSILTAGGRRRQTSASTRSCGHSVNPEQRNRDQKDGEHPHRR